MPVDVQAKANTTVENVSKDLDSAKNQNDQTSALERFQKEIDEQLNTLTPDERKAYMERLVDDLTKSNKLPALALVFADKLGANMDDRAIKDDLRREKYNANNGDAKAILTSSMLKYLSDNYDTIRNASNDEWGSETKISSEDIGARLNQLREMRDEDKRIETNKEAATESAKILLEGGDKSLFNFIDKDNTGVLTKEELQEYVKEAEKCGCSGGHYTTEKLKFVKELIRSWDDPNGTKWLRGGGEFTYDENGNAIDGDMGIITKHTLLAAAGKKSEAELLSQKDKTVAPPSNAKANETSSTIAKEGEGYWQIAERVLEEKNGKKPTSEEIAAEYKRLMELNGVDDKNGPPQVKAGTRVKVGEPQGEKKPEQKPENNQDGNNDSSGKKPESKDIATARKGEGYSHVAVRLLGFAKPDATVAEIEKAFAALSPADKQKIMELARALKKVNRSAHKGVLWVGDQMPLNSPEIQKFLKK